MAKRGNGEGCLYQDKRGPWRASLSLEGGKRQYLSGRTRQEVARKLAVAVQAREQGTVVTAPGRRWPNSSPAGSKLWCGRTSGRVANHWC